MEGTQAFIKTLLDPLTMEIVRLAVKEDLYPNEIAKRMGKSSSLVVKRLKALEAEGVLKGYFATEGGRAVKKYKIVSDEVALRVNFSSGSVKLVKRKTQPFKELISLRPELFEDYKGFCFWLRAESRPEEAASVLGMPEAEAVELARQIKDNLEEAFIAALKTRLENWKNSTEGVYFTIESDYSVIPTHRLNMGVSGIDGRLLRRLLRGETLLSCLQSDFRDIPDLDEQIERLSKRKMVILEERNLPVLNYKEIHRLTKERLMGGNGPQQLHHLGKEVAEKMASMLGEPSDDALTGIFPRAKTHKTLKGERIAIERCDVCRDLKQKACYFIAGVIEGLYDWRGEAVSVVEDTCKAEGAKVCTFSVIHKEKPPIKGTERVKELLG